MTNDMDAPRGLGGFLVTYRMAIYLGGVAVVALPLVLHSAAGVTVSRSVRLSISVATVGLMTVTYLAERRLGRELDAENDRSPGSGAGGEGYPLRTRVAVSAAVLGLAAGVYVALEVSLLAGLLFVGGAYLFAYLAYDDEDGDG